MIFGAQRQTAMLGAAAVGGTALIAAVMVAGMFQPGTAPHQIQTTGQVQNGTAGSAGSAGSTHGGAGGSAGSSGSAGGGGGGGGVPAGVHLPSQGISGGVIHLCSIITQTGPGRSTSMAHALVAWEKSVNAGGGIAGYKVSIDLRDDQGNPDLGATEYRQCWEDEKVFAFVAECAPLTDEQMIGYVRQHDVPLVGECQSSADAYQPPSSAGECFCIWVGGPTPYQNGQLGALLMKRTQNWPAGNGQIALVCLNDATTNADCQGAQSEYGNAALWNGGPQEEQIYDNNYSELIAQWQQEGINHVHLVLDPGSIDRFLEAAANAGYSPQMFNNTVIDDGIAGSGGHANANGMFIGTPWTPLDQNTPGMQRLTSALQTYFPNDRVDLYAQTAWISALIFEHALQAMGHNASESNLITTLNSIRGWDSGMGPVENFSASNHVGPFESALMRLQGAGTDGWRLVTAHGAISG